MVVNIYFNMQTCYKQGDENIILYVKIKANKNRNEVIGLISENNKTYLLINIKAVPEDGKANKELIAYLAKQLNIAKTNILIKSGSAAPIKQLLLKNIDLDTMLVTINS